MATYWENSCSFGLRYVSWYKYLIVSLVFSHLGFWSGNLFLIAPFPDLCLLVPSLFKYHLNDSSCTIFGGSRREDASNAVSNRLTVSSPDEVYIDKIENLKTSGAPLLGITSPGLTWGMNGTEMCIWAGLQLDSYQTSDDLYYIKHFFGMSNYTPV